jgi:O-antigen/teichoic acid export membrane protein
MTLHKQAASLVITYGFEALQPLLVLPYAARALGPEQFGKVASAISISQLAVTFVGYGFHWTAQRTVSSLRQDRAAVSSLFAEVVTTQSILLLAVTIVGLVVVDNVLSIGRPLFLCAMMGAAGVVLFPAWLFIGLERAWQAAIAVAVARCLALVCFVTMVTSPTQVVVAVAVQSAIPLVSALVSLPFIVPIGFGGFRSVTLARIKFQLIAGWGGFLYTLVERALITLPVPLVQHFSGYAAAGDYSIAEKFVTAVRALFRVMTETLLPRVAFHARHNPHKGISLIRRSLLTLAVSPVISLGLFFIAPPIIVLVFGDNYAPATPIIRVMAVIPFLLNGTICMANLYMFNYGFERAWSHLSVIGLLVFLVVVYALSLHLANAAVAVALGVVAKEAVVFLVSAAFFVRFEAFRTCRVATAAASIITAGTASPGSAPTVKQARNQIGAKP